MQSGAPLGGFQPLGDEHQQQAHQCHRRLAHEAIEEELAERLQLPVPAEQECSELKAHQHHQGEAQPTQQIGDPAG